MNRIYPFLLSLLLLLTVNNSLFAGWIIFEKNYNSTSKEQFRYKYYIEDQKLMLEAEAYLSIFDLKEQTLSLVNTGTGVYWHGSVESYIKETGEYFMSDHFMNLRGRSAEEQEMLKATFKYYFASVNDSLDSRRKTNRLVLVNMGEHKKIAGVQAVRYGLYINKSLKEEIWGNTGIILNDEININKLDDMLNKMGMELPGVLSRQLDPKYAHISEKGLMMKIVEYDMAEVYTSEVYKLKQKDLKAGLFVVPAGLKEVELADLGIF